MNIRDFRIGWRMLVKDPVYSAIVVASLVIGLAVCFLLLGFVRYSMSYDADVPQADRIFLLKYRPNDIDNASWYETAPLPYLGVAQRSGMVAASSAFVPLPVTVRANTVVQRVELAAVNTEFAGMFGVQAIDGDLRLALSRPDTLALTMTAAQRLFGSSLGAVGKTVQINGSPFQVTALLPDRPSNTTLPYEALAGMKTAAWTDEIKHPLAEDWNHITGARIYMKLAPGVSAAALEQHLQDVADHGPSSMQIAPEVKQKLGNRKIIDLRLGALPNMYFDKDTAGEHFSGPHGDWRALVGLSLVAVLILLLACGNYVNLATVRTLRRQREIATRKVLGASIGRLITQFLAESLTVSLLATVLGLLLAMALRPVFADLINRKLDNLFTPSALLASLALGVLVGLLAGAYPAWVAVRVRPQQTLSGRGVAENMGGMWVRRMLTVIQFIVAIALTTLTLAIAWQTRFAAKVDLGFDPTPLLVMELPGDLHSPVNHALREALSRVQGVESVAANADPIGKNLPPAFIQVGLLNGKSASVLVRPVSPNFFDTYRLRPVAGRLFNTKTDNDEDGFAANIINVSTARELGFANPQDAVGQLLTYRMGDKTVATGPIVGVAPDIRYHSLHGKPQPILYFTTMYTPTFTVRVSGNMQQVEAEVDALVRQYFPNDIIRIRHAGDYFADSYADDRRLAALLALGTVIAIMLTAFGIYAMSSYSVQRMSRTIVLHKLFGAGATDVARLVGREFVAMIVIGAAIGLPMAILAVENYMATFSERAPTGIWPEVGAVLAVVVVTLISTLKNTVTAIRLSPVRALRD